MFNDTYTYLEYPFLSQSGVNMYKGCPYQFHRMIIEHYNPEESKRTAAQGTMLHKFFYMFFDAVDFNYTWSLGVNHEAIYQYFIKVLVDLVEVEKITDAHFIRNFKAFALFETDHLLDIRDTWHKSEAKARWMCLRQDREVFMRNDEYQMYGTLDRRVLEKDIRIIMDYKTGISVPKGVVDEAKSLDPKFRNNKYTKAQLGRYTTQATYYAMIDALKLGFKFEPILNKKTKKTFMEMTKDGKRVKIGDYYEYIFLWTGYPHDRRPTYYMAYKKVNILTVRSILNKLIEIRNTVDWKRKPTMQRCSWCPLYEKECKELITEFKLYSGDAHFELY